MAILPSNHYVISEELRLIKDANMDEAPARRRAREAFKDIQLSLNHILFKIPSDGIKMTEEYVKLSRGVEVFTKSWLPESAPPKAAIFYCHGYGDTCTFFAEGTARKLVLSGYSVYAMDYPGFGLSEGLHGFIPSFDLLVDDVIEHYNNVKHRSPLDSLPCFLFGQSMGAAVALKIHLKQPDAWSGAVLVAPMCKIADDMVPPVLVKRMLIGMAHFLPKWKLVPSKDFAEACFRDLEKRAMCSLNVLAYKDRPRLQTAIEMLKTTEEIERRLREVSIPLLILHGEKDTVTDPSVSKALYEQASASDKNFVLYKDCFHAILEGESDDVISKVFDDIISWLHDRL